MKFSKVHFSSQRGDWRTPKELFDELNKEFWFWCDLCASPENTLCGHFYSRENSGLDAELNDIMGWYWCNPPYGKELYAIIKKVYESGAPVVMLLPARTDKKWFHEFCVNAKEIRFLKGRLRFDGQKNSAPFPSMIVIFKKKGGDENAERYDCEL